MRRIVLKHDGNPSWVQHQRYCTNLTEQKKESNPNPKTTEQQSDVLFGVGRPEWYSSFFDFLFPDVSHNDECSSARGWVMTMLIGLVSMSFEDDWRFSGGVGGPTALTK